MSQFSRKKYILLAFSAVLIFVFTVVPSAVGWTEDTYFKSVTVGLRELTAAVPSCGRLEKRVCMYLLHSLGTKIAGTL